MVTLGGNSQGYDPGTMDSMYAVLVKMIPTIDPPAYQFSKNFDRERFFYLFFSTVIKTLKGYEAIFLRKVLPQYLEHLEKYPDSLLCRFYDVVTLNEPSTGAQVFEFFSSFSLFLFFFF